MMQNQQNQRTPAEIVAEVKQNFSNQNKDWSTITLNEKLDSLKNDTQEPNVVKAGILLVSETLQQNVVRASEALQQQVVSASGDLQQNVVTALQFVTGALANQPPVWFQHYISQQAQEKAREKEEKARGKEEKAKEKQRKREREEKEQQEKQERKKQRLQNEDERWDALMMVFQQNQLPLQRLQQAIDAGKQLRK